MSDTYTSRRVFRSDGSNLSSLNSNVKNSFSAVSAGPRMRVVRRRPARVAVSALSGGAAAMTAFSVLVAYRMVHPIRRTMDELAPGYLLPPEKVSFISTDNLRISGYFYPHPQAREAIVLCHGFHGCVADVHEAAIVLQNLGYNVLSFDFRGHGESAGTHTTAGFFEVFDVLGAIDYLNTRPEVDPNSIGLMGFSMGAATVIMASVLAPQVKAVIADSAFAALSDLLPGSFQHFFKVPRFPFATTTVWFTEKFAHIAHTQVNPYLALEQLRDSGRQLPFFFIHGENDRAIPVSQVHKLYDLAPEPKQLWTVPGCRHIAGYNADREEYTARIAEFFAKHLKQQSRSDWDFLQAD